MDNQPKPVSKSAPKIKVEKNGPYLVSGGVPLVKDNETEDAYPERDQYSICRCGNSKNKPYCDGSHITSGFKD